VRIQHPLSIGLSCLLLSVAAAADEAATLGGFSLAKLTVDRAQLVAGGPERDGIKSVDAPEFSPLQDAGWIGRDTEVLGIVVGGEARAYPVRMLEFHQIVNDTVGGVPVVVTFDPLAGTPAVYRRSVGGNTLSFGVSGLLYNHNFLLFDRESDSLWSQFEGKAIAGARAGQTLERILVRQETSGRWIQRQPDTHFLRPPMPEKIQYRLSPYSAYWIENKTLFPVAAKDETYHAKELVLGVVAGDTTRAYLGSEVTLAGGRLEDQLGGRKLEVFYDSDTGTFGWEADEGLAVFEAYWLAWKAFHPETEVWSGTGAGAGS
jgi:hypothetical protein